jgi:hypothetical protein
MRRDQSKLKNVSRKRIHIRNISIQILDPWFAKINFNSIYTQQIPSPFYKNVITKSLSDYRLESITRNEEPLLISDQDYYREEFRNF